MLSDEVERYEALTGESVAEVPISRISGYLDGYEKGRKDAIAELRRYFSMSCVYGVTLSWHGASDERAFDRILEEIEEEKKRVEEDEDAVVNERGEV